MAKTYLINNHVNLNAEKQDEEKYFIRLISLLK